MILLRGVPSLRLPCSAMKAVVSLPVCQPSKVRAFAINEQRKHVPRRSLCICC